MNNLTIIGNGKMALSLALGLGNEFDLEVVGRDLAKLEKFAKKLKKKPKILTFSELNTIDDRLLIFCIKPQAIETLELKGEARAIISVMAGVSIERLQKKFKAKNYLRAMPNIAAIYKKSATVLTGDEELKDIGFKIFNSIGKTIWVESQKELDISTALIGSAPAFLALVAEALEDAGVKEGLKRGDAKSLTKALFDGFALLISKLDTKEIKEMITSPGGTTAAGLAILERASVRGAFFDAIEAATKRAKELNNPN